MTISIPDRVAFLKKNRLMRGLNQARLEEIAGKLEERTCLKGEAAILQGKMADRIYFIYSGVMRLPPKPPDPDAPAGEAPAVVDIGVGSYFGEEALAQQSFYATTIRAAEDTVLLEMARNDFHLLPNMLIDERIAFLKRIHLFHGLSDEQFENVAEMLDERIIKAGTELVKEGTEGDSAFLICSGKVRVTRKGVEKPLAVLVEGDYIGEESVLATRHKRSATVTAVEDTLALMMTRENFNLLLQVAPQLRPNFVVTAKSHRLARRVHFSWLHADEVIYFLARKHPILLVQALLIPALLLLGGVLGMFIAWKTLYSPTLDIAWWLLLGVMFVGLLWGVWNSLDWTNDYYIVTNQRVVWLEKVIGIYDSRQEAPLSAIQRVNVETQLTGRLLDYGNVVVRTIVGSTLSLLNVDHPNQAAALMEEHWRRSKETARKLNEKELDDLLRGKLLHKENRFGSIRESLLASNANKPAPQAGHNRLANIFRLRFEEQTTVTYRKHFFVLFRQTWKAALVTLLLLAALLFELFSDSFSLAAIAPGSPGLFFLVWGLLFLSALGWWIYETIDWKNDIFQVTPEQIKDTDKTPLGQVSSDVASLDNILSIEYERKGLLELLLNYGTVYITIGGGKQMAFEDVFNPSMVQDDIERRRLERITNKEKSAEKANQEKLATWFATYYKKEDTYRGEGENIRQILGDAGGQIEPLISPEEEPEDEVQ